MPKRALTISKNVRAPLAFCLTAEAMTEKKIIDTLRRRKVSGWGVKVRRGHPRSTHAVPPATGDTKLVHDERRNHKRGAPRPGGNLEEGSVDATIER